MRWLTLVSAALAVVAHPTWHIGVRVADEAVTERSSSLPAMAAFNHIYNHIIGLRSPASYSSDPTHSESVSELNNIITTPLFKRPSAALVFAIKGGASILTEDNTNSLNFNTYKGEGHDLSHALLAGSARRDGVSPYSIEVVGNGAHFTSVTGAAIRWDNALGFTRAGEDKTTNIDADYMGIIACTQAGKDALAALDISVLNNGFGSCSTFTAQGKYGIVELDAGKAAVAHALSEVAYIVLLAQHTAKSVSTAQVGVLLQRAAFSGPSHVAHAYGMESEEFHAVINAFRAAIAYAQQELRAVLPLGRLAVIVFGSELHAQTDTSSEHADAASEHAHADHSDKRHADVAFLSAQNGHAARFLQTTDPNGIPTMTDVAAYQVALWTGVILAFILIFTIYSFFGMDEKKDPALYAEVIDSSAAPRR